MLRFLLPGVLASTLLAAEGLELGFAPASDGVHGLPAAWEHVQFPSVKRPTEWAIVQSGTTTFMRARAVAGASCLVRPLDGELPPRLCWRWRVDRGIRAGTGETRATDDFAARVGVGFEGDWSDAGWLERREAEALHERLGRWPPRRWIHYVWSAGRLVRGEAFDEPYRPTDVKCVALRVASDPGRRWFDEDVDPRADYARFFGTPAPRVAAVMIMTDADDTGGTAEAMYADLRLTPRRRAGQ